MTDSLNVRADLDKLQTGWIANKTPPIAAGIILEELSTVLMSLGLQGLDSTGTLIHILHSQHVTSQLVTTFTSRLNVLVEALDKDPEHQGIEEKDTISIVNLFTKYTDSVAKAATTGEFSNVYTALMPIFPPLIATSVIMHANKKENTRCVYYDCPSLWALFLLIEDVEDQGRKESGIPPKELFSCFTMFHAHSRCPIAHAVIATFRFLILYAGIPGIQIILPVDPTKKSNRAIDIMKNKCTLIYSYILNVIDRSALKSASKSAGDDMPDSLGEYIAILMRQLQARYNQLFSISILKGHKPIRPVKPVTKNNRGGNRFNKIKDSNKTAPKNDQSDI